MSEKKKNDVTLSADSLEVRARLAEALKLDLVGPWPGHPLAEERLQGWVRPSNWYLTGFLIPLNTPPEQRGDADGEDDMESEVPEEAGLAEESNEERKAAKKSFFPSSMGSSFLVSAEPRSLSVTVRWGDYAHAEIEEADGKSATVWQRQPREARVQVPLKGGGQPVVRDVPGSGGRRWRCHRGGGATNFARIAVEVRHEVERTVVRGRSSVVENVTDW